MYGLAKCVCIGILVYTNFHRNLTKRIWDLTEKVDVRRKRCIVSGSTGSSKVHMGGTKPDTCIITPQEIINIGLVVL